MTTTDGGLAEFMLNRYDEAEARERKMLEMLAKAGPDACVAICFDDGASSNAMDYNPWDVVTDYDPAHRLADIALKRAILARVIAIPHEYVEGDPWYSCRQAVRPSWDVDDSEPGEPNEPGSGCIRDDAGGPCDCGRDGLVGTILRQLGTEFDQHPAYEQEWRPE